MKKLRTIKPIPGIPVGTELHPVLKSDGTYSYGRHCVAYFSEKDLEGFVEEVKEPEEFWCLDATGKVCPSVKEYDDIVPNWLRFSTKESAEKFAKALSASVELFPTVFQGANDSYILVPRGEATNVAYDILSALNDRVK